MAVSTALVKPDVNHDQAEALGRLGLLESRVAILENALGYAIRIIDAVRNVVNEVGEEVERDAAPPPSVPARPRRRGK